MKRTLVLIRHAKSDWNTPGQPDFERTLNERGKADAPVMGQRLLKQQIIPDLILSSSAKRAAKTARLIAKEVDYKKEDIQYIDRLYHATPAVFESVISEMDINDAVQTLFMVAHNPGITQFAFDLLRDLPITDLPTCAIVGVSFEAEHWHEFRNAAYHLSYFDYPKNQ
jgi:phosphohistidine phosphatase